jgi:hypothetical protein
MRKTVFFAAGLLLAGCGGIDYGIGPGAPLGKLESMDAVLVEKGLDKRPVRKFTEGECFGPEIYEKLVDLKVHEYKEYAKQTTARTHVLVGVDESGAVRAVQAEFSSMAPGFTTSGGRTQNFIANLWLELNGAEPSFSKQNRPGIEVQEFLLTTLAKGGVRGRWEKFSPTDMMGSAKQIMDRVLLWRE